MMELLNTLNKKPSLPSFGHTRNTFFWSLNFLPFLFSILETQGELHSWLKSGVENLAINIE